MEHPLEWLSSNELRIVKGFLCAVSSSETCKASVRL